MALTLLHDTLRIDLDAHVARGEFLCPAASDIPAKGSAFSFAVFGGPGGAAIGAEWYVDKVQYVLGEGATSTVEITARQPGFDWTWLGLRPIARRSTYKLIASPRSVEGAFTFSYFPVFSNWVEADDWDPYTEPDPLTDKLVTWDVEFVDTVDRQASWQWKVNGVWPVGFAPPAGTGSGRYKCVRITAEEEPVWDYLTGTLGGVFRHHASFWQAPVLGVKQLTFVGSTWT